MELVTAERGSGSPDLVLLHGGGFIPYQLGRLRHARTVRPELANSPVDPFAFLPQLFFDTINGYQKTGALKAAIDLDLFTAIGQTPATASESIIIAKASQTIGAFSTIPPQASVKNDLRVTLAPGSQ